MDRPTTQEVHDRAVQVVRERWRVVGPNGSTDREYRIVGRLADERPYGRRVDLGSELPIGVYVVLFGNSLSEVVEVWSVSSQAINELARRDSSGSWWFRLTEQFRRTPGVVQLISGRDALSESNPPVEGQPWTKAEIAIAVDAYAQMLSREIRGEAYSKTDAVRALRAILPARSAGSIERKLQNISAILDEVGLQWIDGYKPLSHYQRSLREIAVDRISPSGRLAEALASYGETALIAPQAAQLSTDDVLVDPPHARQRRRSKVALTGSASSALGDFRRRQLGRAGEEWVLGLERERLARLGRSMLADRVFWVSNEEGDGAGFDIRSYWPDGRERRIEVKTTNFGVRTPFYITRWEVETSRTHADSYSLYRVHGFARDPRIYVLDGSIEDLARLDPQVFLGMPL